VPDLVRHRVSSLKPPAALASPLGAGIVAAAGVGAGAGVGAAAAPAAAAADANCYLCGRKFASTTQLLRHEVRFLRFPFVAHSCVRIQELSELHRANVAALRAKTEVSGFRSAR
jgi:hypothetical protein